MKINITLPEGDKTINFNGSTISDLFKHLRLNTEEFIVKKGQNIVVEADKLQNNDKIEFIKIISGG